MLVYPSLAICFLVFVSGSPKDDNLPIEKYSYVASIESNNRYLGGASIVSRHFVLTYGLTILGMPIKGGLLSVRTGSNFSRKNGTVHTVCDLQLNWLGSTVVALLQLADPISFDRLRQPIRLFSADDEVKPGAKVRLSAWTNLNSSRVNSPRLKIFDGVVKENCSENTFGSGAFCIDRPTGIYESLGQGHPVEIDGMQAGIVVISMKGDTHFIDVPTYFNWIIKTMQRMSNSKKCPGD